MVQIQKEKCVGCASCLEACFSGALHMEDGYAVADEHCIYCGKCINVCPVDAIYMEETEKENKKPEAYKNVWIIVEHDRGSARLKKVSYELLSEGRKLADRLGEKLCAVDICGSHLEDTKKELEYVGCDEWILAEDPALGQYSTELYSKTVKDLVQRYRPSIVLFPGTENGRDLAPRVSASLNTGLTADCTALDINEKGELVQIRPTYGGNVIASIVTPYRRPQMASVRANVFEIKKSQEKKQIQVEMPTINIEPGDQKVYFLGRQQKEGAYKDVEEANVLLIGGYGLGKAGFEMLFQFAHKVGVAVGATRKAVDEGWAPFEIQIGQTGKMAAPELCICFGVSGALQHTIGIRGAKRIVAVNKDPAAQIFNMSDVAVLGDCKEILQELDHQLDEKKKEVFSVWK